MTGTDSDDPGEPPDRDDLRARLGEYAWGVVIGWARSGQLRKKALEALGGKGVRGIQRVPDDLDLSKDIAEMVAIDMLEMALRSFWGQPLDKYRPDCGTTIETYYTGYVLMQLPGAYEKFFRREIRPVLIAASIDLVIELYADDDPGPEEIAEVREQVARLANGDQRLQQMLLMRLEGYTASEIADKLSREGPLTTEAQVYAALRTVARRARDSRRRRNETS